MKKILFVDYALDKLGGVERTVSTIANSLVGKYEIDICSVYKYYKTPFYSYDKKIKFHYLIDNSRLLSTNSKTKTGFYFFRVFEKIYEKTYYVKRIKDFCESEMAQYDTIIFARTMAAAEFLPHMENYHGQIIVRDATHLPDTPQRVRKCMKKYFPAKVNTFIVSSAESKALYENFFEASEIRMRKIYNPLGICPKATDLPRRKEIIGVGRYTKEKGFENLIAAFARIYRLHPDWKLSLIGGGENYHRYKRMCRFLGIHKAVEFRKSKNIVEEYCRAGVFVMCSRHEGYANALVEALACGVPSVSYNWYVGADDIIEDGVNGIIARLHDRERYFRTSAIDQSDVKELADAINLLIENEPLRIKLAENAVKIVESREKEKIIDEWIKMIEGQ